MEEEIDLNTIFNARILNNSQNILLNDTSNTQVTLRWGFGIFPFKGDCEGLHPKYTFRCNISGLKQSE